MALTVTEVKKGVMGDLRYAIVEVDFDSSYPTGGESFAASDVGFTEDIYFAAIEQQGGYVLEYDDSNAKIIVYRQTDPADAGGADVPLVEVAASADLSTDLADVRVLAVGK